MQFNWNRKELVWLLAAFVVAGQTNMALASGITKPGATKVAPKVESAASEAWRKNPPQTPAPRPFKLPSVSTYKLDNGLTVQLLEDHRVPFITVELGIKSGSAHEPRELLGLSSMTANMLSEGTKKLKSKEIAEEVDFIGGGLRASADADFTIVVASALSKYTDRLFNIMSDVVLNPSFPEDELKLKKTNLLQELIMKRSDPDFLVSERFAKVVYGDHPYSVVAPEPETVERISKADLEKYHAAQYVPNNAVLIVVGDFDKVKLEDLIKKSFGAQVWPTGNIEIAKIQAAPKLSGKHIYLVDRPGSVQSTLRLGNLGLNKTNPDFFPMLVANQILGGASHSRLFTNIRENKGYTYGAYSGFSARKDPGSFAASADVRTEVTTPSLQEFIYELEKMRNLKVEDKEMTDSKNYLTGSFQLGLETQAGLAQRLLEVQMYDLPANYLETYTDKVMAVTPDDVRRVARKYIDLDNMVITVVGDANKIKRELELFAPVDLFDTQGKSMKEATGTSKPGA
jgi:zinc protease